MPDVVFYLYMRTLYTELQWLYSLLPQACVISQGLQGPPGPVGPRGLPGEVVCIEQFHQAVEM